jgi:YD repeat-containing protein
MRRFLATTLLLFFVAQSSGGALAATTGGDVPPLGSDVAALLSPLREAATSTHLYAQITGQEARYEALHEQRPLPVRRAHKSDQVSQVRAEVSEARFRLGVRQIIKYPRRFDPTHFRHIRLHFGRGKRPKGGRNLEPSRNGPLSPRTRSGASLSGTTSAAGSSNSLPGLSSGTGSQPGAGSRSSASSVMSPAVTSATPAPSDIGAGMKAFWTYQTRSIPGIGAAMLNVNTGNLVIAASDFDVQGPGLDLTFPRFYNSQSLRDAAGDDGGDASIYGNQWTNPVDAHLVFRNSSVGTDIQWVISVYDGTGARYDYTYNGNNETWTPPPGQHATLGVDPNNVDGCGFWWQQTDGTVMYFKTPEGSGIDGCTIDGGDVGRLYEILGRNQNDNIQFAYSWVTGSAFANSQDITAITATHSDGQSYEMTFGKVNGNGPNELQTIARPDGQIITYKYDSLGDLREVDAPGNDAANVLKNSATLTPENIAAGDLAQTYIVPTSGSISSACGPRATISTWQSPKTDGACVNFDYDPSNRAIDWYEVGVLNPIPGDGVGKSMQTGFPTAWTPLWDEMQFAYPTPSKTTMSDYNGHATTWKFSATANPITTTVTTTSFLATSNLATAKTWDANENLISSVDTGGNETDYLYDANGNLIEKALPSAVVSVAGTATTLQPLSSYSYAVTTLSDGYTFSNLIASCDAVYNATHSKAWTTNVSDGLCPSDAGATQYGYTVPGSGPSYEPNGELTSVTMPSGYVRTISYAPSSQDADGIDYGLPTQIAGKPIAQTIDNSVRTPQTNITYDGYGDIASYNNGVGTWHMTYDAMNNVATTTDADSTGPANLVSYTCRNADESVYYTETPYQRSLDGNQKCQADPSVPPAYAVSYTHDADGDVLTETHHHGGSYVPGVGLSLSKASNVTTRVYDGLDRLIEVQEPYDTAHDIFTDHWDTRYLYDLTSVNQIASGTTVSFPQGGAQAQSFQAYGNLYSVQELLPAEGGSSVSLVITPATGALSATQRLPSGAFQDEKGYQYDALDRTTALYTFVTSLPTLGTQVVGTPRILGTETIKYDAGGFPGGTFPGLPSSVCNAMSPPQVQCEKFGYNALGELTNVRSTGPNATQDKVALYDVDGRTAAVGFGGAVAPATALEYTYDLDGNETAQTEPTQNPAPSKLTYKYYADGLGETISASPAASGGAGLTQANLFTYSYYNDGNPRSVVVDDSTVPNAPFAAQQTDLVYAYYASGRPKAKTASLPGGTSSFPTSEAYDSYGQLSSITFPPATSVTGTNTVGYGYNAEGEVLTSSSPAYTSRGELAVGYYANGFNAGAGTTTYWDDMMGVPLSTQVTGTNQSGLWTYDQAGRMNAEEINGFENFRAYDAENRTIAGAGSSTYAWDAAGHLSTAVTVPGTPPSTPEVAHWSGSQLLYTTNSSNAVDDVKIGAEGDLLPVDTVHGVTLYERGLDSSVGGCYNTKYQGSFSGNNSYIGTTSIGGFSLSANVSACGKTTPSMPTSLQWWSFDAVGGASAPALGAGGTIGMPRTDGLTTGTDMLQGVRAYNQMSGTWTTPDFNPPDPGDPMTFKSYMWNGNNPVSNRDPSGLAVVGTGVYCNDNGCYDPEGQGHAGDLASNGTYTSWMSMAMDGDFVPVLKIIASVNASCSACGYLGNIASVMYGGPGVAVGNPRYFISLNYTIPRYGKYGFGGALALQGNGNVYVAATPGDYRQAGTGGLSVLLGYAMPFGNNSPSDVIGQQSGFGTFGVSSLAAGVSVNQYGVATLAGVGSNQINAGYQYFFQVTGRR